MEYIEHLSTTRLYPDGHEESGVATVISEHNLSVIINEQTVYRLVCTKNDRREPYMHTCEEVQSDSDLPGMA